MLYAQVTGSYDWRCPKCNHQNRHKINPLKFTFKCRNPRCEYTHVFGVAHWKALPGRKTPPPDQMVFEAGVWRSGSRTNVVLCESCGKTITESMAGAVDRSTLAVGEDPIGERAVGPRLDSDR